MSYAPMQLCRTISFKPKKFYMDARFFNILTATDIIRMRHSNGGDKRRVFMLTNHKPRRSIDWFKGRRINTHLLF